MSEKRKVEWSKDLSLSEIYSGGLQMALCSPPDKDDKYTKATSFVTCKDFFQDAVQATHLGEKRKIWSFEYDPKTDPALSFDRVRILIGNTADKGFAEKIEGVLDFINQFEKRVHLIRTRAFECEPTPGEFKKSGGIFMFEGSGRWMIAPPMISLYTLLLRCGFSHKNGEDFDNTCKGIIDCKIKTIGDKIKRQSGCYDDCYLRDGQLGIKAIVEHGYARLFYKDAAKNYPDKLAIGIMHDVCGIVGFSQKKVKSEMPYWYRLLEPKAKKPGAGKKVKTTKKAAVAK